MIAAYGENRWVYRARQILVDVEMLGIDIIDAGLLAGLGIALLAGFISFVSPCVLPVVPAYLAYMSGMSFAEFEEERRRREAVVAAMFFVLGLSTIFAILGFAASALGVLFLTHQGIFGLIAGTIIIVFGLSFLGLFRIPFLYREFRLGGNLKGGGALGAYLLGLAFAFGWVPCIGPVLGAILALAAQEDSVGRGTLLLTVYAVGLGIPFLLCGAFIGRSMKFMNRIKPHLPLLERGIGLFLVAIGLLILTGRFSDVSWWILEVAPWMAAVG